MEVSLLWIVDARFAEQQIAEVREDLDEHRSYKFSG